MASAGIGAASASANVGTGSSRVLAVCISLLVSVESFRSLARRYPFCTKVSWPLGSTSLTVASRSTSGVDEFIHRYTAPAPTTVVVLVSGAVR